MASVGDGERDRRNKRAWRKPRNPISPETDPAQVSSAKTIKLQRSGGVVPPSLTSSAQQLHSPKQDDIDSVGELEKKEVLHEQGDAAAKRIDYKSEIAETVGGVASLDEQGLPLHIDGSVMEGVSSPRALMWYLMVVLLLTTSHRVDKSFG